MGYSETSKPVGKDGMFVGEKGAEVRIASAAGGLFQKGVEITPLAAKINTLLASQDVQEISANGACNTGGFVQVVGGTGLASLTLAAPSPGTYLEITVASLSSGTVVVTCASGVTFDGTNNTATFNAALEALRLAYTSATQWEIIENVGAVALSDV